MDDLKKEINDLKKRIRKLEKKFTYNDKNSSDQLITQAEKVLITGGRKLRKVLKEKL